MILKVKNKLQPFYRYLLDFFRSDKGKFTLSVVLASIVWFSMQLSASYTVFKKINIELKPLGAFTIDNRVLHNIPIKLNARGLDYLSILPQLKNKTLIVELPVHEGQDKLRADQLSILLEKKFGHKKVSIDLLNIDDIPLVLEKEHNKKIKVQAQISVLPKSGYIEIKKGYLRLDSVVLSGSKAILDTLKYVRTKKIILTNVQENFSGTIPLEIPKGLYTKYKSEVPFDIFVTRLTEKKLNINIQTIINSSETDSFIIIPSEISLQIGAPLSKFEQIDVSLLDIKIRDLYKDSLSSESYYHKLLINSKIPELIIYEINPDSVKVLKYIE